MSSVALATGVLARKTGQAMVLLNSESGQYFELNEMAAWMLENLLAGQQPVRVANAASEQFAVAQQTALDDIQTLLDDLRDLGLLM